MKVPIIVIGYGLFEETKKLFSYEESGVNTLPVFTSPVTASLFMSSIMTSMGELLDDKPTLMTQVCTEPAMAISVIETIGILCPGIVVKLNPKPVTEEALKRLYKSGEAGVPRDFTAEEAIEEIQSSNGL